MTRRVRAPLAPWRAVLRSRLGSRSQRIRTPGGYAIVCGAAPVISELECGHKVTTWDTPARTRRRCKVCRDQAQPKLPGLR